MLIDSITRMTLWMNHQDHPHAKRLYLGLMFALLSIISLTMSSGTAAAQGTTTTTLNATADGGDCRAGNVCREIGAAVVGTNSGQEYRGFIIFDLTGITDQIVGAQLSFNAVDTTGTNGTPEQILFSQVTSSLNTLESVGTSTSVPSSVFVDLGSSAMASVSVNAAAPANYRWTTTVNHLWLDSLRGGKAAIGMYSGTIGAPSDNVIFYTGSSIYGPPPQLTLTLEPIVPPSLVIDDAALDASGGTISVPVLFTPNAGDISSLAFSLDYDAACLSLDETDANNDDIPDAVSGFPGGYIPTVTHDGADSDGELDISLFDQSSPLDPLSAGAIATVAFDVVSTCSTTAISFSTDPAASFGDTNGDAVSGTATGGTLTLDYNSAPTDIALDNDTVDENALANTVVGNLSTTDADTGDSHTYSLVAGTGDSGNASFNVVGSELRTAAVFDFESAGGYFVRIQTDDGNGGTFEKAFNITVNDVNEAPTGLTLNNQIVDENLPSGSTVGNLTTSGDPDTGDSHTYSLTGGATGAFAINGDKLGTAQSFNFETQDSYAVTIRTTDGGGLFYEESVTITVNDLNDAPVAVDDIFDPLDLVAVGPTTLNVLANDTDEDGGALYIQSVSSGNAAIIDLTFVDDGLEYTPPAGNGSESFTYIATDSLLASNAATVNITYVADDLRGDCNSNGSVDAGDFSAIALEFFDVDSSINWWQIYQQGFAGSPIGCDANASENGSDPVNAPIASVAVDDIICTVLVFFGDDTCTVGGGVQAAGTATPATLSVAHVAAETGDAVDVPITLDSGGHAIAAAGFTIEYDTAALAFDAEDADGDGLPDAVSFHLPAGVQVWVQAEVGAIQVAVAGLSLPLPELGNGALAAITFDVLGTGGAVSLRDASMGDTSGGSIPVVTTDGTVGADGMRIFLPMLVR